MNMFKQLGLWILQGIIGLVMIGAFALFLVEYMAGCGETYTDSKGRTHHNECVFIR